MKKTVRKTAVGKRATGKTAIIDVVLPKKLLARVEIIGKATNRTAEQVCYDALKWWMEHGKIKVPIELDTETNRLANAMCKERGITFDELIERLIDKDRMAKKGGAL